MNFMILPSIPYMGSKAQIAMRLIEYLPPAETFVDLFAGGGAMTTAAILSGKYKRFVINDKEPGLTQLYVDAANGKYKDERRWISREDFFRLKATDAYVRFCWSFGNNGRDYLYGKDVEPIKKALHYAAVLDDYSLLEGLGISAPRLRERNIFDKYRILRRWIMRNVRFAKLCCFDRLQSLERLESLESLERLERLKRLKCAGELERLELSYDEVTIPDDACVYCDPPYRGTRGYGKDEEAFDHERFYEWLRTRNFPVYVSEYAMPEDFVAITGIRHRSTLSSTNNSKRTVEKLFVHERFARNLNQIFPL